MATKKAAKTPEVVATPAVALVKATPSAPQIPEDDGLGDLVIAGDQGQYGAPENNKVIQQLLAKHGAETEHVGGSFPPAFPKVPREGGARLFVPIAIEHIDKENSGGAGEFDVLLMDIVDPRTLGVAYRAQHVLSKAVEDFFGSAKEPAKGVKWNKGLYVLTYCGQLEPKDNGRSGMKLWRIDEAKGLTLSR